MTDWNELLHGRRDTVPYAEYAKTLTVGDIRSALEQTEEEMRMRMFIARQRPDSASTPVVLLVQVDECAGLHGDDQLRNRVYDAARKMAP